MRTKLPSVGPLSTAHDAVAGTVLDQRLQARSV